MKKLLFLALFLFLPFVFAMHTEIPLVNWENSELNDLKKENFCECWSLAGQIKKQRNPNIDALLIAKSCVQACSHCELKSARKIEGCLVNCLSTGAYKKESILLTCMQSCTTNYCQNEIKLGEVQQPKPPTPPPEPVKEEKKVEVKPPPEPKEEEKKIEIVPEEKKEEKKEVEIILPKLLTIEECKTFAKTAKKEDFCAEEITMSKFILEVNKLVSGDKDKSSCDTVWKEYYKSEKNKCPKGVIASLREKRLLLPIILILIAFLISGLAIFYYLYRKNSFVEEVPKEEPEIKIEPIPEPKQEEPQEEIQIPRPVKNLPRRNPFSRIVNKKKN